jgi:hypothetical protein
VADAPTCGRGLADHSRFPEMLAKVMDTTASTLEAHLLALDLSDPAAVEERDAYVDLVSAHRRISAELQALGHAMAGYANLPMARHNEEVLASERVVEPFIDLLAREEEIVALLHSRVEQHRRMLDQVKTGR